MMKRNSRRFLAVAGIALAVGSAAALAQTPPRARPATNIPRTADGKPDFSGIWQSLSGADYGLEPHPATKEGPPGAGVVEGNTIPYTKQALEQRAKNLQRAQPPTRG